ncbi:MAG: 30S ribosomal protein S8 [Candidatus Gracilibacteria bacterium]
MNTDPIADLLTRLRNAYKARKTLVKLPYSNLKFGIAKILEKNKYLASVDVETIGVKKNLLLTIPEKGIDDIRPDFDRISTPGKRVYKKAQEIKPVNNGYGLAIISTSKGLMTSYEAHHAGLGGEVLCEVY